ncbi:MAG: NUDIX domain-containing protein [Candidatus Taylorbacteria bacterium]|nr:NUDIX domain-containing protein [Candidatus Taylorbacteria bacterium]
MQIQSHFINQLGQTVGVIYNDINDERDLGDKKIQGVHAYCFYKDKLVVVYAENKGYWTPPGGGVEEGETICEAVSREVKEETNMKVLQQRLIGYQDISEPQGIKSQTRSVCIVEPYGPFITDPDGDITKIELIDPKDYKKYFDWGEIGEHIIARALEVKAETDAGVE